MYDAQPLNDLEHAFDVCGNTLLIVEDDDALRERMAQAMIRRGFDVTAASSVAEALAAVEENPHCFAIVDLSLLDGSGLTVVERLRDKEPACRTIILTGYGTVANAVELPLVLYNIPGRSIVDISVETMARAGAIVTE